MLTFVSVIVQVAGVNEMVTEGEMEQILYMDLPRLLAVFIFVILFIVLYKCKIVATSDCIYDIH